MTIRDNIKQIAREVYLAQGSPPKYRMGTVAQMNSDGTCNIMIDGAAVQASPMFPVVMGEQVVVMRGSDGSWSAAPIRAKAPVVPFEHPPFFTGGFIRFGQVNAGNVGFQDVGSSNFYILNFSDLVGYSPQGTVAFSPDGTRVAVFFQNAGNTTAHIRVYKIGPKLISAGTVSLGPPPIFTLQATLLLDIVRPSVVPTLVSSPSSQWVTQVFLTNDSNSVWWVEFAWNQEALPNDGDIRNTAHLFTASVTNNSPAEINFPLVTQFYYTNNIPGAQNKGRSFFNIGLGTFVPLQTATGNTVNTLGGGGMWAPDVTPPQFLGVMEDPQNGFGSLGPGLVATGTGVPQNNTSNSSQGPGAAVIMTPTGIAYAFNGYALDTTAGSVASGGMKIVLQSVGNWASYEAVPGFAVGTPPGVVNYSKKFRTSTFSNIVNQTTGPATLSFFYLNIATGITVEAKFVEPVNPADFVGGGSKIMLSSTSSGLILDNHGSPGPFLRRISSADGGLTWTVDPVSKAITISPGTILPLAPLGNATAVVGVSTL